MQIPASFVPPAFVRSTAARFAKRGVVFAFTLIAFADAPAVRAASLYWDADAGGSGNSASAGTGLGSAGSWNNSLSGTPLLNWWPGSGTADQSWVNANNDTAVFWGTAGTVSFTDNITAGGLLFNTTGYTLNTGANTLTLATGSTITLNNIAAATITGAVTGTGAVTITRVTTGATSGSAIGTLNLNGTSTGGWSGATTISYGATLALSGSNQALLNTSSIALGGGITLTNTSLAEAGLNRISDTAAITSTGGTFTVTNTVAAATPYSETIGAVTLSSGRLNVVTTNANTGGTQVLTLANLTQSGSATVGFGAGGGLNTGTNQVVVTGKAQTTAGQIIGPWATTGTSAASQTDYAVYDGTSHVVAANIAASAETTWTAATDSYTLSGGTTLTAARAIGALRATGAAQTLALGGFNLDTNGILNGGSGTLTISGTGNIRQQGTAASNLYINAGSAGGAITISSIIANNTGALTLVKTGAGTLTVSGLNTYTGDTIIQEGTFLPSASTVVNGNIFVGSLGGGQAAVYGVGSTNTLFKTGNTVNATVYSNGTFNFLNNGANMLGSLTIIGGTATTGYGFVNGGITMTGGPLNGASLAGGVSFTTNASATTALVSTTLSSYYGGYSFSVADGAAAIDLNVTGKMNTGTSAATNGMTKTGAGLMQITALNTYTGTTTINGGTLRAGVATTGANGAFGNNGAMTLANTSGVTLDLNGFNTTIGSLAGGGATGGNVTLGTAILTTGGNNASTSFGGVISGTGGVVKVGTGIQTLTGSNTYTGGTTVSAGKLVFGNSFTMSGANAVSVAATGTAGVNYATVSSTAGTLTFGGTLGINISASLSGGESFTLFSANGGAFAGDFGSTAGNVSITGSYVASLTNNGSGSWIGTDAGSGLSFTFDAAGVNAGILTVSAVPEPATYAAFLGVLVMAGAVWRRRRAIHR